MRSSAVEDLRDLRLLKIYVIDTILANGVDHLGMLGFRLRRLSSIRFERCTPSLSSSADLRLHRTFVGIDAYSWLHKGEGSEYYTINGTPTHSVAPYEADAQLAYFSSLDEDKGGIAAVILEDSDLLAYGCSSVVFKMDRYGNGEEIVIDKVFDYAGCVPSFRHFDTELFTGMCVLAGCDFLSSVPGIGIAKAHALVSKYRNLDRVLSTLKYEKGNQMPEDYFKSFKEAFAVFQNFSMPDVYDAESKKLKHLTPLPETLVHYLGEELDFLGPEISSSQATAIAEGQLDPSSMKGFDKFPCSNGQVKVAALNKPSEWLSRKEATNAVQPSNRLLKQETAPTSCFTIVSTPKTVTKRIAVMEQEPAFEKTQHKANLEEWKSLSDTSNLEKLISPLKNNIRSRVGGITAKRSSKVPDNNPFKRRKETFAVKDDCVNEQLSEVTEDEELELICISPATQRSIVEQQSLVTEIEDLETLGGISPSSHKSVESKHVNKTREKKRNRKLINKSTTVDSITSKIKQSLCGLLVPRYHITIND
ncbi:hypothetical protein L6452_15205 [Arctium lappa]|uniref:Uncharacterized protein n=1 Tax=Arctium lappa TaxID=4217 RepID=A0ACB9CN34_ARCLA|nr:hypothetical protein L6452_15205 [Arctium lappa]